MIEYANEPVAGLPGMLPPGERILWQGSPDRRVLARTAFHTRGVAIYFALLTVLAAAFALRNGSASGLVITATLGIGVVAMLQVFAVLWARSTIYTLTDRRIVLRIGVAVPKCVNLPLTLVGSVDLATRADGTGDIPLTLAAAPKLGYLALWPHARPWRLARPQPMLRAVPDATRVAALIARTCSVLGGEASVASGESRPALRPAFVEAQAA